MRNFFRAARSSAGRGRGHVAQADGMQAGPRARTLRTAGPAALLPLAGAVLLSACAPGGGVTTDPREWIASVPRPGDSALPEIPALPRPAPDGRGLIQFPSFAVVVAKAGETVSSIAGRLGLDAGILARYNRVPAGAALPAGSVVSIPPGQTVRDPFAGQGVKTPSFEAPKGGSQPAAASTSKSAVSSPAPDAASSAAPAARPAARPATATNPQQHRVAAGETAWSIARKYSVSVADLAAWNGLGSAMGVRTGQLLLVPAAGQRPGPRHCRTRAPLGRKPPSQRASGPCQRQGGDP